MFIPAPYQEPEKAKKNSKEAKGSLRRKGTSDAVSGETEALSSHEGDEDEKKEEGESDSPLKGRREKSGLRRPRGGGVQKGENIPPRRFGFGHRSHPRVAPQGEAPGRIVSIRGCFTYIRSFMIVG